ncbi:unnamed protein product [Ceratitis capitata]|uniref:(Mediterranean fruit fly) hypothetical protein n=1 Tax=Ceratitis capitata TaxID=7213 RepID=A0A811V7M2_CERCA|nr:unnamed protein product [Ceratitis capitata]
MLPVGTCKLHFNIPSLVPGWGSRCASACMFLQVQYVSILRPPIEMAGEDGIDKTEWKQQTTVRVPHCEQVIYKQDACIFAHKALWLHVVEKRQKATDTIQNTSHICMYKQSERTPAANK